MDKKFLIIAHGTTVEGTFTVPENTELYTHRKICVVNQTSAIPALYSMVFQPQSFYDSLREHIFDNQELVSFFTRKVSGDSVHNTLISFEPGSNPYLMGLFSPKGEGNTFFTQEDTLQNGTGRIQEYFQRMGDSESTPYDLGQMVQEIRSQFPPEVFLSIIVFTCRSLSNPNLITQIPSYTDKSVFEMMLEKNELYISLDDINQVQLISLRLSAPVILINYDLQYWDTKMQGTCILYHIWMNEEFFTSYLQLDESKQNEFLSLFIGEMVHRDWGRRLDKIMVTVEFPLPKFQKLTHPERYNVDSSYENLMNYYQLYTELRFIQSTGTVRNTNTLEEFTNLSIEDALYICSCTNQCDAVTHESNGVITLHQYRGDTDEEFSSSNVIYTKRGPVC